VFQLLKQPARDLGAILRIALGGHHSGPS
jgi:hypothetical protein